MRGPGPITSSAPLEADLCSMTGSTQAKRVQSPAQSGQCLRSRAPGHLPLQHLLPFLALLLLSHAPLALPTATNSNSQLSKGLFPGAYRAAGSAGAARGAAGAEGAGAGGAHPALSGAAAAGIPGGLGARRRGLRNSDTESRSSGSSSGENATMAGAAGSKTRGLLSSGSAGAGPRKPCEEGGYCSLGISKPWVGDIGSSE